MYIPITSEVTITTGMFLKEISTNLLFTVEERIKNDSQGASGPDRWRIVSIVAGVRNGVSFVLGREELSDKFFAAVDE